MSKVKLQLLAVDESVNNGLSEKVKDVGLIITSKYINVW